jgi:hypothetical protein
MKPLRQWNVALFCGLRAIQQQRSAALICLASLALNAVANLGLAQVQLHASEMVSR